MKPETINKLVTESLAIEAESAQDAGTLGYMARAMVQATMPHKKTTELVHQRSNGDFHLTMMAAPDIGLPYGSTPVNASVKARTYAAELILIYAR